MTKHTNTNLEMNTVKELRTIAKGYEVKGRWDMRRDELIKAILHCQAIVDDVEDLEKVIKESGEKSTDNAGYKKRLEMGTLVAFIKGKRLLTGKVVGIHENGCSVETSRGVKHVVVMKSIAWVKTGHRWPNHIFQVLKGNAGVDTICLK